MIAVNVNAGLANQMFHYAFGCGLMAKGFDVCFDLTNFKPRKQWAFEDITLRDAFPNIEINQMPEGHFKWVCTENTNQNKIIKKIAKYARAFHNMLGDETYIKEPYYAYQEGIEKKATKNCIFKGFWQSEKYFKHCSDYVRKQFVFLPFDEPKNIEISKRMSIENSVAIHLRKGKDYLQSELMGKGLCTADYYMAAIDYISKHVDNPVFYVFTDNPQWVIDNLPKFEYTLVNWNKVSGKRSFRDMQLMSCVKHNIIGNSTYSWWGAWLNPNPQKIVIGPKVFMNPITDFYKNPDVICEDWIKI